MAVTSDRVRRARSRLRRASPLRPLRRHTVGRRWQRARRRAATGATADPGRLLWVDPRAVRRYIPRGVLVGDRHLHRNLIGTVRDGDWDLSDRPVAELAIVEAICQRVDGASWEDTRLVREARAGLARGEPHPKFRRPGDFATRLARFDRLIDQVRRHGYRTQEELGTGNPWDEILVAFDRHGRIRFVDGRHRLAVALAFGIERTPVRAMVRHRHWQQVLDDLAADREAPSDRAAQHHRHPDLVDLDDEASDAVLQLVVPAIGRPGGRVLELGAGHGALSQQLASQGFEVVAAEPSARHRRFLRVLRDAAESSFEIADTSALGDLVRSSFDAVVALDATVWGPLGHGGPQHLDPSILSLLRAPTLIIGDRGRGAGTARPSLVEHALGSGEFGVCEQTRSDRADAHLWVLRR